MVSKILEHAWDDSNFHELLFLISWDDDRKWLLDGRLSGSN